MKKTLFIILLSMVFIFSCVGCGKNYQEVVNSTTEHEDFADGYFSVITKWGEDGTGFYIIYANDTKVKYFVRQYGYQFGITPLYNADGSLQVYEESK